jgi:hypothetical protein
MQVKDGLHEHQSRQAKEALIKSALPDWGMDAPTRATT